MWQKDLLPVQAIKVKRSINPGSPTIKKVFRKFPFCCFRKGSSFSFDMENFYSHHLKAEIHTFSNIYFNFCNISREVINYKIEKKKNCSNTILCCLTFFFVQIHARQDTKNIYFSFVYLFIQISVYSCILAMCIIMYFVMKYTC